MRMAIEHGCNGSIEALDDLIYEGQYFERELGQA